MGSKFRRASAVLALVAACYLWRGSAGRVYAVGTTGQAEFHININGSWTGAWFTQLDRRFYVGATTATDIVTVTVDGQVICQR